MTGHQGAFEAPTTFTSARKIRTIALVRLGLPNPKGRPVQAHHPRAKRVAPLLRFAVLLVVTPLLLSSCYITGEGLHYLGLLSRGRPVAAALADPKTPEATKELLRRATAIEAFGRERLGQRATRNFRKIVELEGDTLVHVVQACAELSFDRYLWNYPLVGKLPYRGYFETAGADKEAARLRALGYDVIVRPADAFSTLGWLSDPLWSFMSNYDESDLADLVLHELTHATAFYKGGGDWNEELATFVGREGSLLWLADRHGADSKEVAAARAARKDAETFAAFLGGTAKELEGLYAAKIPDAEKRARKASIIAERAALFAKDYDKLFGSERYRGVKMDKINNAWLDLYRLYEGEPALYRDYYEKVSKSDLRAFIADMAALATGGRDPKITMRERLSKP
jgi:predicted aminopeptidase